MTTFTPSADFEARWLATPLNIRRTIYQELEDIKTLLRSDNKADNFQFNTPELEVSLTQMQAEHEAVLAEQNRLTEDTIGELREELSIQIDARMNALEQNMQSTVKDMSQELKIWLNAVLDERLAAVQKK